MRIGSLLSTPVRASKISDLSSQVGIPLFALGDSQRQADAWVRDEICTRSPDEISSSAPWEKPLASPRSERDGATSLATFGTGLEPVLHTSCLSSYTLRNQELPSFISSTQIITEMPRSSRARFKLLDFTSALRTASFNVSRSSSSSETKVSLIPPAS